MSCCIEMVEKTKTGAEKPNIKIIVYKNLLSKCFKFVYEVVYTF